MMKLLLTRRPWTYLLLSPCLFFFVSLSSEDCAYAQLKQKKTKINTQVQKFNHSLVKAGPMLGFGGMKEVRIWVQTTKPAQVKFIYWSSTQPTRKYESKILKTSAESHLIAAMTLSDLTHQTQYEYTVIINGQSQSFAYPLRFTTQQRWQRKAPPPDFTLAVGSCAYFNLDQDDTYGGGYEIFEQIKSQSPDFMLWLGDTVYLGPEDWGSSEGIFRRYAAQRAHPSLQSFLASTHHYAIWDDHDYGPNDSNRSYPLKGVSLEAFKTYWGNPHYGLPELPGVFGTFSWSDVDFFLLDDRTYRAPGNAPNQGSKPMLGEKQLQWLIDALAASRATFKVIAVGSQVLNPFTRFEGYSQHGAEKAKLIQKIKDYAIEGVVFLTGDRHFSELNKLNVDPWFYPLYDFTSSPLTSRSASSVSDEINNPLRVEGTLVVERNFGLIKVGGQGKARFIEFSTVNAQGKLLWKHLIKASDLKIPKNRK